MKPLQEVMERSAEARDILNDQVVAESIANMRDRYMKIISSETTYSLTVRTACVKLQLLEEFLRELKNAISEEHIRRKRGG